MITLTSAPPAVAAPGVPSRGRRLDVVRHLPRLVVVVAVFLFWHVFALTSLGQMGEVPTPVQTLARLAELFGAGSYWSAIGSTLLSWAIGLSLSFLVGVPLGLIIGSYKKAEASSRLVIDFLRTIPAIAFLPLALLLFGVGIETPVLLIFLSAVWALLIQATYAAAEIDPVLKQVSRSFHLSRLEYVTFQFAPASLPFITTGLRVAATICLLTAVSVEFLSGAPGIGTELQSALIVSQTPVMYAYVITAGILGVLINTVMLAIQRALMWWHPSVRSKKR